MRTLLVEDEPLPLTALKSQIERYCPEIELVGEAYNVAEAANCLAALSPELVFLDIHLPDGTAFDLLDQFPSPTFQVIFVTAYEAYALKAFRYNAAHYLVKPLLPDDLREAVDRVSQPSGPVSEIKRFMELFQQQKKPDRIAIPSVSTITYVDLNDILHLQSDASYTQIHLSSGRQLLSTRPLKTYDELLRENGFCRVHRSHLVNLSKIAEYRKGDSDALILTGGTAIEVSRKKRTEILRAIDQV